MQTYVILEWSIAELFGEYFDDLATTPSLLAVGVVSEVIWFYSAQVVL